MSIEMNNTQPKRAKAKTKAGATPVITGVTPVKTRDEDIVARGREAFERLKSSTALTFDHWKATGDALVVGRQLCMKLAHTTMPRGKKYNMEFSRWLEANSPLDEIHESDRRDLFKVMDHLAEIEEWRATLTEGQRASWNSPSTIWRVSRCGDRGLPRLRSERSCRKEAETDARVSTEDDQEEIREWWQSKLLVLANQVIGAARETSHWPLPEPPDRALVDAVRAAAMAMKELADYLEEWSELSPEEMEERRQAYAEAKAMKKARKADKVEKAQAELEA